MTTITLPAESRETSLSRLAAILRVAHPGKRVEVSWEPEKVERSSKQNRALFGHAYKVIGDEAGLSGRKELEEFHRKMCIGFFGGREVEAAGQRWTVPVRTTTTDEAGEPDVLPMDEFAKFYAHVERLAAGCGIDIPAPNPRWKLWEET